MTPKLITGSRGKYPDLMLHRKCFCGKSRNLRECDTARGFMLNLEFFCPLPQNKSAGRVHALTTKLKLRLASFVAAVQVD